MDEVSSMKAGSPPKGERGIPTACECGASLRLATSTDPLQRGHRYFGCYFDLTHGPARGCGFKKSVETSILEEIEVGKDGRFWLEENVAVLTEKIDTMQTHFDEVIEDTLQKAEDEVANANLKFELLEVKYLELERRYGELLSEFEGMQSNLRELNKYL